MCRAFLTSVFTLLGVSTSGALGTVERNQVNRLIDASMVCQVRATDDVNLSYCLAGLNAQLQRIINREIKKRLEREDFAGSPEVEARRRFYTERDDHCQRLSAEAHNGPMAERLTLLRCYNSKNLEYLDGI